MGGGCGPGEGRPFGGVGVERAGREKTPERGRRESEKGNLKGAEKRGRVVLFREIQKEAGPTHAHAGRAECNSTFLRSRNTPEYPFALVERSA